MALDVLAAAKKMMRRRQFDKAIMILQSRAEIYEDNFEYYLLFAVSCLYVGDTGTASAYFQKARRIRVTDTTLLLGQAALFLRRGDTDRALQYYLDVLDYEPGNKIARNAMEFIRTKGDYSTICKWVDTGDIEQFYPPLGLNPYKIAGVLVPIVACILGIFVAVQIAPVSRPEKGTRADLTSLVLSVDERKNIQETDLSSGSFAYILSSSQINESYEKSLVYFQNYRDNMAQIEINRILNSNASVAVKRKATLLMSYLEIPSFDTIKDVPAYSAVQKEPALYLDCWISWSGRISNVVASDSEFLCDLLVGYETMEKVDGIVPLKFAVPPKIENDRAVTVLAKIVSENGKLTLLGKAVYQSIKNQ